MKNINPLLLLLVFIFSQFILIAEDGQKAKLVVKCIGLKSNKGSVKMALCNSIKNYEDQENPFIGKTLSIKNKIAEIEIDDIPYGDYAIKSFHDENDNNDLDTNFLGLPVEDYGFSNNARGTFGPPSWKEAKFKVQKDYILVEIELK